MHPGLRLRLAASVLLLCLGFAAHAHDTVGLYTSPDGTGVEYLDLTVPGTTTVYLVLEECSEPSGVLGYECRLDLDPGIAITGVTLPIGAYNIRTPPELVVALDFPIPHGSRMLLATIDLSVSAAPAAIRLGPVENPSFPGYMIYVCGDDPGGNRIVMHPSSGSFDDPVFGINTGPLFHPNATIFVDPAATGEVDGASWEDAFHTLSDALTVSRSGDAILVACGTYFEHGLEVPGGVTIQSASGDPDCVIVDAQQQGSVFVLSGEEPEVSFRGLTITNGRAYEGGGIYAYDSTLRLEDCKILGNEGTKISGSIGGGVWGWYTSLTVIRCRFEDNLTRGGYRSNGGAIALANGDLLVQGSEFYNNIAGWGGAIEAGQTSVNITGTVFFGNGGVSSTDIGAIRALAHPSFVLAYCTFAGNRSQNGCDVYAFYNPHPIEIVSCIFYGSSGKALLLEEDPAPVILCTDIYGNAQGDWTGAIAGYEGMSFNLSADPLFCGYAGGQDLRLRNDSPCLESSGCTQIGARGMGCSEGLVPPTGVVVDYGAAGNSVSWEAASPKAIVGYRIHRSVQADFEPSASTLVMETTAPPWVDLEGTYDHHYQVTAIDDLGNESAGAAPEVVTDAPDARMPSGLARLGVAHPNPFNPSTTISYSIPRQGSVTLRIFDLAGRPVRTLVREVLSAGEHSVQWNGKDDAGDQVASGVYLYRLAADGFVDTRRMVLLK